MKNTVLALMFSLVAVGCSSGSTVTELPQNVTSLFRGTFQNTPGTQSGTVTIDIVETASGTITGNIIFESSGNNCLTNSPVTGNTTGFNLSLSANQASVLYTITTTITKSSGSSSTTVKTSRSGTVGTTTTTNSSGSTTVSTTASNQSGTLNMQFAISNNGNAIDGSYVVDGDTCSNETGSGSMNLNI